MKLNSDKCKLLTNNEKDSVSIKIGNDISSNITQVKLLGITLDKSFIFNKHVTILCKKANQNLHALARISKYMSTQQLRLIMKAFISSQFGYCPLIWMFHNRKLNSRINRIQERSLRFVYNDHKSTFSELLKKDNSVTVHNKNIQVLATEIYKIKQGIAPGIIKNLFPERKVGYNLRNDSTFQTHNVKTVKYGTETISFQGPKIWKILPDNIKNAKSLDEFKCKIKTWVPWQCACRICKTFIIDLGFL